MSDPEFYLGRMKGEQFKLPSTTFLTHAAILGASGSGKTVMCKSIVEEAVRAEIPIIAIDPKGDIGALGIGLGDFTKERLLVHAEVEAADRGRGDPGQIAEEWIDLYEKKLEDSFGPEYEEIEKDFTDKVAVILITPKNSAGVQISLTPNFEKPTNYDELMSESPDALLSSLDLKIQLLLSRCGIKAASSTDNRVIFLSTLIRNIWEEGKTKNVELEQLIEAIQYPPFEKVGSLEVDKFISKVKRSDLARNINALMVRAVPGVDLDFEKLVGIAKNKGKTPIIVFDLRKISDADEKSNFVAEILGEVQRWVWSKGGTSRLRAILFFDELYGFMPAGSLTPPSKTALLIILKQARAAGLGCILATQNPGDLDYRGLSNIATWILGRLATNQDIAKVEGALKPVFEGAGGTSQEFAKLMGQIRALKPGNFVAYNPNYGVNMLQTRWLLSLHKGPLTDNEIKVLTLRPPKPKKKETAQTEAAKAEAVEEEEPKIEFEFIKKKPATGKITERFLNPKITTKGKQLNSTIYDRLSITGNSGVDGFTVQFGKTTNFYSPLFFSKTMINIKRTIKEGYLEFPVEITEEMTRSFNLSKKIEWNSTTIEGIHASSLPPSDLSIQAMEGVRFYKLDKEIITKLPDNIIWYFTQNPFKEAEAIYHQKLREFEKNEVDKLAGKKGKKELSKLSTQISRIEERLENENRKLDETIIRLENFQGEKRAREAEGKSIKATERSIESNETKITRHEEKVREFRDQIKEAESQRQDLMKEQQSAYEEFHKAIEVLKSKGAPQDLYRPGKADISISEKAIYWIPRLLVPITLTNDRIEDVPEKKLILNLNLYNGNADVICDGCGTQISTENYYQTLLESEISPPTFICLECLKTFCSEHITFCSDCGKKACPDHSQECMICKKPLCTVCGVVDSTGGILCNDHSWNCIVCEKGFSKKIPYKMGKTEQQPVCSECEDGYLFTCPECSEVESISNAKICGGCGKHFCPNHMSTCKKCQTVVCNTCGRVKVKIKNEEVVARCVQCS